MLLPCYTLATMLHGDTMPLLPLLTLIRADAVDADISP